MSRANLMVRFPDGTIRHGLYDGTSDIVMRPLYATAIQAWDVYCNDRNDAWGTDEQWNDFNGMVGEAVEIFTDYGGGFWWHGEALTEWVTSGIHLHEDDLETYDGRPDWVINFYAAIRGGAE